MATAFAALAHRKIKPGGVIALVLPLSAAAGLSWQGFRGMLGCGYTELSVHSIAAARNDDLSFSADTGMAECLVIAHKLKPGERPSQRMRLTSLSRRPHGLAHAAATAKNSSDCDNVRWIEEGPYGGTHLSVGDEVAGGMIAASTDAQGAIWGGVRLVDYSVGQTAYALGQSKFWLPGHQTWFDLPVAPLSIIGRLGLVHRLIIGPPHPAPFSKIAASPTATYPSLWNHDAKKETRMVCAPDSSLQPRPGMEAKAAAVWETASRVHLNLDFRFNSQPLSVAFTNVESVGGRAWPNVRFDIAEFDYACGIWGNSTLGLLSFWWQANRQVAGRGTTTINAVASLPVLDFRALSDEQLIMAELIFEEFRDKELKPAYLADADPNRALLDRRVVCDLLGFDEETYVGVRRLAAKWCAEPSVHGGKSRPRGSGLVV